MNSKELLLTAVGIFLTIVAWLVIDIYQIKGEKTDVNVKPIVRLDYNINKQVIDSLSKKIPN